MTITIPSNLNATTLGIMAEVRGISGTAVLRDSSLPTIEEKYEALSQLPITGPADTQSIKAEIERLKAENRALRAARRTNNRQEGLARPLRLKVSPKGAVSIYGLGKLPFTLYRDQLSKLLSAASEIQAFMTENSSNLSVKPVS